MIYALTAIIFALQLSDWYTTRTILKAGGYEANPIMAKLFQWIGMDVALALKTLLVTGMSFVATSLIPLVGVLIILFYSWVVYHNVKELG